VLLTCVSSESFAALVLKLCAETLHFHLSSEASKVFCDCSALPLESRLRLLCASVISRQPNRLHTYSGSRASLTDIGDGVSAGWWVGRISFFSPLPRLSRRTSFAKL
jgi:hypothetical protein